jgi:hypothetical protein
VGGFEQYTSEWEEFKAQQERLDHLSRTISDDQIARAAQINAAWPHLSPGVVLASAQSGADDETVTYLAMQDADRLNEDPLYRRIASGAGSGLMFGLRVGLSAAQGVWWGGVGRPTTSWLTANNNIAANQGVKGLFNPQNWLEELPQTYRQAGMAPIETQVRSVLRGEETDWRLSGDVWGQHYGRRENMQTVGRTAADGVFVLADQIGMGHLTEPGTRAYDFTKSVVDLGFEMLTDPTILLGKSQQVAMRGQKTFTNLSSSERGIVLGAIQGPRRTVLPEVQLDNWLSSDQGRVTTEWLAQTEDFAEIFSRIKIADASLELKKASTVEEVSEIISRYAGRQMRDIPSAPLAYRIERGIEDTWLARIWDQAEELMPDMPNYARFKAWTPKSEGMPLSRPDVAIEQFNRWFVNWRAPKEVASSYMERMAEALVVGDRHAAWGVWQDAQNAIGAELTKRGHSPAVIRALSSTIGGPDFTTGTRQRAYWMEKITEPIPDGVSRNLEIYDGTTWHRHVSPHQVVDLMDEAIPFPNLLEIRRATSRLGRLDLVVGKDLGAPDTALYQALFGLGKGVDFAPKGLVWSTHDMLWAATTAAWMPLALITRIAWPVRVTLEEQLRMAAVGMDSMFQHPLSYISWAIANPDTSRVGRVLSAIPGTESRAINDIVGDPIRASQEFQQAMVMNRPAMYGGPRTPKPGAVGWDALDMERANPRQQIGAARIGLGKLWNDPVSSEVAEAILRGDNNLDSVFQSFYGSRLQLELASKPDDFAARIQTPEGVRGWLESLAEQIRQLTGGDTELIEAIATGQLRGRQVAGIVNPNKRWINKIMGEKIELMRSQGTLHRWWVVPQDVIDMTGPTSVWNQVTSQMFYMLGAVPSNVLSRSPVFAQAYWRRIAELMEFADHATQKAIVAAAKKENLPKEMVDDIVSRVNAANRLPTRARAAIEAAEEAGDVAPVRGNIAIMSLDEADLLAKEFALRTADTLLYQLSERGQTLAAMRLVFPFGEAWKEIGLTWSRLMGTNLHNVRRGQIIIDQAREGGFLYTDPVTGLESYNSPGAGLFSAVAGLPDNTRAVASSPLQGVNLFAGSALPGIGPVFSSVLGATLPDNTEAWRDLRGLLLPFGSAAADPSDLVNPDTYLNVLLPAWIKKALTATLEDGFDARMWRSHVNDSVRVLQANGEYGTSQAEIRRLTQDAEQLARRTLWFRALGQATLPTGFRVDFQVDPESSEAQEQMRKVLGDDFDFGKDDGGFLSMAILASLWHTLREEADGDSFAATQAFLTMFGTDPDNYELYQWVASLGTGKTTPLTGRSTTLEGRMWEDQNARLIEEIPAVVGLFAPVDEESTLDIAAIIRDVQTGDRYAMNGRQFIIASQKIIGTAIWRETVRQTEGNNSRDARAYRAARQAWLDENLPYWRRDRTNVGVPMQYSQRDRVEQLEQAITYPEVLATPAGSALKEYMDARENALQAIIQTYPDVTNREQAQIALQRRAATAPIRSTLRQYGERILAQTGEFQPIWDNILLNEVGEEETE